MKSPPWQQYQQIDAVNWSTLREFRESPLKYRYRLDNVREDTASLAVGRAVHTAVFEPQRLLLDYTVYQGRRAGKAWDAFREAHHEQTILTEEQWDRCHGIQAAVRAHPLCEPYLHTGAAEQVLQWTDAETRLRCKGRLDWISTGRAVVDLKTTRSIQLHMLQNTVARYGYHTQIAFYLDGHEATRRERLQGVIIAVESQPPYDVGVFVVSDEAIYAGQEEYRSLLTRLKWCRESGQWPGRYTEEQTLDLPAWMFDDEEDPTSLGITIGGEAA